MAIIMIKGIDIMKKIIAIVLSLAALGCMSGCGSSSSSSSSQAKTTAPAASTEAVTETETATAENTSGGAAVDANGYTHYPTPEDATDFTGVDFSKPDIQILSNEYDRMKDVASQIQSYALEGVVIEIDGVVNSGMSHSIQVPNADGSKFIGTTMEVVGFSDSDYPADRTRVHIKGIIRPMNEYAHGIFVPKDNFEVVE